MLALIQRASLRSLIPRRSPIFFSKRTFGDRILDAYKAASIRREQRQSAIEAGGCATRVTYEQQVKSQRTCGTDAESGIVPTKWQRRFLVITTLYRRQSDIPKFVANGTMNRMHYRMRVVFVVVAVCFIYVVSFFCETNLAEKILRDRAAGVRV